MLSCHSIWAGDPLCQSWSLAAVTTAPPSSHLWPDAAGGDSEDATAGVINASQWVHPLVIWINITDLQTFPRLIFAWFRSRKLEYMVIDSFEIKQPAMSTLCRQIMTKFKKKEVNVLIWLRVTETRVQRISLSFHAQVISICPPCSPTHPSHFTLGKTAVWGWSIFTVQQSIKLHQIQ